MNLSMNVRYAIFAVGGAVAGGTATYFITKKRIQKKAFAWADEEIQSVKDTYRLLRKEPPYDDPRTAAEAYLRRIDELDNYVVNGVEDAAVAADEAVEEAREQLAESLEVQEEVGIAADIVEGQGYADASQQVHNIFDQARQVYENSQAAERDEEPFDELKNRDPRPPFIITFDDFFDDSNDFDKITISYYQADKTLADDRDALIPDIEGVVGRANMQQFGVDSQDKNTVYIRNEKLQVDYEVTREEGSYTDIVQGMREMDEARERREQRKMRSDDE